MARLAGRSGRLYVNLTSGGVPEPVTFIKSWSIDFAVDNIEVTAMGDTNKIYVSGLPDASGSFAGCYDDATVQTYTAAIDGVARSFYLYPTNAATTKYFFGTALFDFSVSSGVGDAIDISGNWNAATTVTKVG